MILLNDNFYRCDDLNLEGNLQKARISINSLHDVFQGHFPGNPVVPGVCMIQILKELLEVSNNKHYRLQEARNIKFMNVLNPSANPTVTIVQEINEEQRRIKVSSSISDSGKVFLKFTGIFEEMEPEQ